MDLEEKIDVTLSSFRYTPMNENFTKCDMDLVSINASVCVVDHIVGIVVNADDKFIDFMAKNLIEGMEIVVIDSKKPLVYVGTADMTFPMVLYDDIKPSKYSKAFFDRWDDKNIVVFEYNVYTFDFTNRKKNLLFVVRGLWVKDKWQGLKKYKRSLINIIDSNHNKQYGRKE